MQCKMLVVSSELEERLDMRVVIWVLEKCSMKVVSGGIAFQTYPLTEESGQELNEALKSTKLSRNPEISVEILKSFVKSVKSLLKSGNIRSNLEIFREIREIYIL